MQSPGIPFREFPVVVFLYVCYSESEVICRAQGFGPENFL